MSIRKEAEIRPAIAEDAAGDGSSMPRKLTFAENVILTIKVLAAFGLVGAALWGMNLWTAVR